MTQAISTSKPVWRDLDQKALDDAYDQDVYAPNRPLIVTRRIAASERTRAILGSPERVAYGPSEHERLDIFRASAAHAPINLFIHGGAWRRNKGPDYHLQAEPLVHAGAHCLIADFINVEQAGGDLFPMYEQVRRAIAWAWHNAHQFGGDRERFYISAHSSGSHLAACVLTRRLARGKPAGKVLQGRATTERHVRSRSGAAVEALVLCEIHRRDGGKAQRAAPSRRPAYAARTGLRHAGDAGIPAPDARVLRRGAGGRQARRADRRRGLQSFRALGDARQSVRPMGRAMLRQMELA